MVIKIFDAERAIGLQRLLAQRVLEELEYFPPLDASELRYIAAFDTSYTRGYQCAVAVVYDISKSRVVEKAYSIVETKVPYIPGLLAFREIPGYICTWRKLSVKPNVLLVDGHGLAHPRAFGIATHMGLVLEMPSIGVAKSHLYGEVVEVCGRKLIRAHGRVIGEIIEHMGFKLYVSVGYKVKLDDAVALVKNLLTRDKKLPTPLQLADEYSKIIKAKYCKK